jgi:hypothetical protein
MTGISAEGLDILRHSLGLDERGRGRMYRNHFCAGGDDAVKCRALVAMGFMVEHPPTQLTGGDPLFVVTAAGKAVAGSVQSSPQGHGGVTR